MTDLTPPEMNNDDIDAMIERHLDPVATYIGLLTFARAIEAHVNEQWQQRLEVVGTIDGEGYLWNDLTKCTYPEDFIVYRIKEQG